MSALAEHQKSAMLDVPNPFDLSVIESIPLQTADNAEQMLQKAHALFKNRDAWLEPYQRIEILNNLAELVTAEQNDIAMLIAREGGKPLTDAKIEMARAIDGIGLAIKELMRVERGEEIPMGHTKASEGRRAHMFYEPIGIVVAVSAFNHPFNLLIHQAIPAIATGCPVIVKPAGDTPLCALKLQELVDKSGLSEGWCQTIICDNDVAEKLVTDARLGFFSFIGSAKVGWMLRSKLAPGVRCALEHGGAAPVIVDKTADLDTAIPSLIKGGFYHSGQVCVSVQRVFVEESLMDAFSKRFTETASKLVVGDATKEETEAGPLIRPREVDRVDSWVQNAIEAGATLLTGGKKLSDTMYAPTVLLNPPTDAEVSTQEIFGPVVCLYSYSDRQEAINQANNLDVAFQAAVYTNDLSVAQDCIKRLDATAVMVNDHTAFRVDWMPFAGRRHSGHGIGGIGYTMHDMLTPKMAVFKE
jgi:acyl-CoA reductase-like NAD-dependent aldehyde dehydrogenase